METNNNPENISGAVLVIGAGIAGMQAALDLSASGFKVYLVEKDPAVGGHMVMLDKTFPTNDCSMCTISPRLTAVGRDPNIELITLAEVEEITGKPGNFTATVNCHPRYVDQEKCTGCGDCFEACPIRLPDEFNQNLSERTAIYKPYPQAVPNVPAVTRVQTPPCQDTCPAGTHVQGYLALARQKKYIEAYSLIKQAMPFPSICGRVCTRFCEKGCTRNLVDKPVSTNAVKRFIADKAQEARDKDAATFSQNTAPASNKSVAIIGSGPAGLTAADRLARYGHKVTIFEAQEKTGGMLRYGIPDFRLPQNTLDQEIQDILSLGVEVKNNTRIGKDITLKQLQEEFNAVFISIGAQLARELPITGIEADGVYYATDFLRGFGAGKPTQLTGKVVVIGGGDVAFDVARSALRLPGVNEVHLCSLESHEEMPASQEEMVEGQKEGVIIHNRLGPNEISKTKQNTVNGIRFKKVISVFDSEGRFAPQFHPEQREELAADAVICAVGQRCDLTGFTDSGLKGEGILETDSETLATSEAGIFAGGDVSHGPATVIEAVADGNRAALGIHNYLNERPLNEGQRPIRKRIAPGAIKPPEKIPEHVRVQKIARQEQASREVKSRINDFVEIEKTLTEEQVQLEAKRCLLCGGCSHCRQCEKTCEADAIDLEMVGTTRKLEIGAVIVAGGFDLTNPKLRSEYGYGRYKNVMTSLEFERLLSASGPTKGHVQRPSDGNKPKRIAFIQCVGSRDTSGRGNPHCSAVCCTYATKQAIIAREHEPDITATIFYIDLRFQGKGYEQYYQRARDNYQVRYIRGLVSAVRQRFENGNLRLRYVSEEDKAMEEEFDLVVLSMGISCAQGLEKISRKLGLKLDQRNGFLSSNQLLPTQTSREGIFASGVALGPKDIPDTVIQASAAVAGAADICAAARGKEISKIEYPEEREVATKGERVGVFVCRCGINISSVVDIEDVLKKARKIPGVAYAEENMYTCSPIGLGNIKQAIIEHKLDRVVVTSCSTRTHEPLFRSTIREQGLNMYLFELANIRDQCSWVHQKQPEKATAKAIDLLRGAVAKVRMNQPLSHQMVSVCQRAMVVGGGLAGLTAALTIAKQGFEVVLVERESELGGALNNLPVNIAGHNLQQVINELKEKVKAEKLIKIFLQSTVHETSGSMGNFSSTIKGVDVNETITHGATIIATGALEHRPAEFAWSENTVSSQSELARDLKAGNIPDSIAMLQCAGSRSPERPFCNKVCCNLALHNALAIKEKKPETKVVILNRDIVAYGTHEQLYLKAREAGVIFQRYQADKFPEIKTSEGKAIVAWQDQGLNRPLSLEVDRVVLSTGLVAPEGREEMSKIFKLPLTAEGFFQEAHVKLAPIEFSSQGNFLCGTAHSPQLLDETISQAQAAASKALIVITQEVMEVGGVVAEVKKPEACARCLTCVRSCPYSVPEIKDNAAIIDPAACHGCGICAAACPAQIIELGHFDAPGVLDATRALVTENEYTAL